MNTSYKVNVAAVVMNGNDKGYQYFFNPMTIKINDAQGGIEEEYDSETTSHAGFVMVFLGVAGCFAFIIVEYRRRNKLTNLERTCLYFPFLLVDMVGA